MTLLVTCQVVGAVLGLLGVIGFWGALVMIAAPLGIGLLLWG